MHPTTAFNTSNTIRRGNILRQRKELRIFKSSSGGYTNKKPDCPLVHSANPLCSLTYADIRAGYRSVRACLRTHPHSRGKITHHRGGTE